MSSGVPGAGALSEESSKAKEAWAMRPESETPWSVVRKLNVSNKKVAVKATYKRGLSTAR
ncbi:MAG: hypothetical protein Q8P12_07965 [bacterium]|nr:hypothetical protein [bacterium]